MNTALSEQFYSYLHILRSIIINDESWQMYKNYKYTRFKLTFKCEINF